MELKLFGKNIFSFRTSRIDNLLMSATEASQESKFLPDFYNRLGSGGGIENYIMVEDMVINGTPVRGTRKKQSKEKKIEVKKNEITPVGLYELKTLNDDTFSLNTDGYYVDSQIKDFKDKLSLIEKTDYDMRNGVNEISSILVRFENRKKYGEVKDFFENYPYTKTSKIADVISKHENLKIDKIAQFIADMPKEAIDAMKNYNKNTQKVCGKDAIFYIIADKKDFKKSDSRKDPILLAQSPFGHFWQIIGAWDSEMLFLEEL